MDITFNEGQFYPHLFSDAQKQNIRRSNLWPLAADIHKLSLGELYIGAELYYTNVNRLHMANKAGKIVLKLGYEIAEQKFSIGTQGTYLLSRGKNKYTAKSKRISYLIKMLKKDNAALLKKAMKSAEENMEQQINKCFGLYATQFKHIPVYSAPLQGHQEFEALKHIFRESYSQSDEARGELPHLKQVYESFCVVEKKAEDNKRELLETFANGMWVIGYMKSKADDNLNHMVFGAARLGKDIVVIPDDTIPFRLRLASFESIPGVDDKTLDALKFALVLCKTSREQTQGISEADVCVDPDKLIPEGDTVFKESGSVCYTDSKPSYYHPQWFIIAR